MKTLLSKALVFLLAGMLAAPNMSAESAAAMLYSTGSFLVNGAAAPRSSAVMPGDKIQTSEAAAVSITRTGSNVLVSANSAVVYHDDLIQLERGSAVVTTSKRLPARVEGITVAPAQANSTYRVSRVGKEITVAALKGNLLVTSDAQTRTVAEGRTASLADPDPEPQDQNTNTNASSGRQGGAVPGATRLGGTTAGLKAGLIAAGAAVTITSIIVATQVDKGCDTSASPSVSPVCP